MAKGLGGMLKQAQKIQAQLAKMQDEMATLKASYCILVIPLLIETGSSPLIDRVLVVESPKSAQIQRVCDRDNTTPDTVEKMIAQQASPQTRRQYADDILNNDSSLSTLRSAVSKLHKHYLALASEKT